MWGSQELNSVSILLGQKSNFKNRIQFLSKRDSFIWQNCHVSLKCHSLGVDRQIINRWSVTLGFHCPQYLIYIYSQYGRNMQQCNTKASLPSCTKLQIHCWRHKSGKPSVCWAKLWDDPRSIYSSKFTSPISCQNWWKVHISGYTCEKTDTHGRIHVGTRQTSWERVIKKCDSVLFIFTGPFFMQCFQYLPTCLFFLLIEKVVTVSWQKLRKSPNWGICGSS